MESTLTIPLDGIRASVLVNLGWDVFDNLSDRQKAILKEFMDSGVSQVYNPVLEGSTEAYEWSFLRPVVTLALPNGATTIPLPDDYDGIEGRITVNSTSQVFRPIEVVSEGTIRENYAALPTYQGRPQMAAEQCLKALSGQQGQRFQLFVFPKADADYSLQFAMRIAGEALTGDRPYAYGGPAMREVYIESCLSIAEERLDDMVGGAHGQKYQERLRAAVLADQRRKPQLIGYNGDRSDDLHRGWQPSTQHGMSFVTVKGVQY